MGVLVVVEGKHESGGAARALIQQVRPDLTDLMFERLANSKIHVHPGNGKAYFKKAVRWMLEAKDRGFDAIILLVDRDGVPTRCAEIADAQNHTAQCPIPRALGVPVEAFDAWMLADEQAISSVLAVTVPRQPDPENIAHPKDHFEALLRSLERPWGGAQMYTELAKKLDIKKLEARCPTGFGAFANRVRNL